MCHFRTHSNVYFPYRFWTQKCVGWIFQNRVAELVSWTKKTMVLSRVLRSSYMAC